MWYNINKEKAEKGILMDKLEKMLEIFIKEFGEDHWCVKDLKKAIEEIKNEKK